MSEVLLVQLQAPDGRWRDVGHLQSEANTNRFTSLRSYWDTPRRPVLGQVFEQHSPTWVSTAHTALPNWFSHLLPEGRLRAEVSRATGINTHTEFSLLRMLGQTDLPGAVRVVPGDEATEEAAAEIADAVEGAADERASVLKFSLAGLQMKFSVSRTEKGLTVPIAGAAGDVILKLPDPRDGFDGVPEAEYAAMRLARSVGIPAAAVELVETSSVAGLGTWSDTDRASLAVSRYDRLSEGLRVHTEELAQVFGISTGRPQEKYSHTNFETIARTIATLVSPEAALDVVDRIVLNVLVGNGDAHLKNWSLIYPDGINASLSPVYDVVPTVLWIPNDDLGLNLNGSKSFEAVEVRSFERLAITSDLDVSAVTERVTTTVERVLYRWADFVGELRRDHARVLTERLQSLPLARPRRR